MLAVVGILAAAAIGGGGAIASGSSRPAASGCARPGATLVEKVGQIEVFLPNPRAKLFVCARGHAGRELHAGDCGSTTACRFFPSYLIAGPYVFYADQVATRDGSLFTTITRVDPRTGLPHDKTWSAGGPNVQMIPLAQDKSGLTDFVARADGSAAWIYRNAQVSPATFEVHREDGAGVALVASSPTIAPGSLALAGSTFYWTNAGIATSATFTPAKGSISASARGIALRSHTPTAGRRGWTSPVVASSGTL